MNPYVSLILTNLVPILATLIVAASIPLVKFLCGLLTKWTHIQVSADQQEKLDGALAGAIGHVDELALGKLKAAAPTPFAPGDKMAAAVTFAVDEINRLGLDKIAADHLQKLLEAKLNASRDVVATSTTVAVPGTGASTTTMVTPAALIPPVAPSAA